MLESDFFTLCQRYGLPRPEANVHVARHEVDVLVREQRLVVETDGWTTDRTRRAFTDEAADVAGDLSSLLAL